jgi:hypothetical protein
MGWQGGAIFSGGDGTDIINCIFYGNSASFQGGGIYEIASNVDVINCTFFENSAVFGSGILYEFSFASVIKNCIFWSNDLPPIENGQFFTSEPVISFSNIEGGLPYNSIDGGDNIDDDPLFIDETNGNLRLSFDSPGINAGTNDIPPTSVTDLNGLPRILDGVVDMGAYEFVSDCDGNGTPDYLETDGDGDGVTDVCDVCSGYNDHLDNDGDGIPNGCDLCPDISDPNQQDDDGDGIGNACDICEGTDDLLDTDGDTIPDGCDVCPGGDDRFDGDGDGVPNDCDVCTGSNDSADADGDTVPDGCDICPGSDDLVDSDADTIPNGCDVCSGGDDRLDGDADGVPDTCDVCLGFDDNVDTDSDSVPNECDACPGFDDLADTDTDTIPDGCDICPGGDDLIDGDGDGAPDDCDLCLGFDDGIDSDGDGAPNGCDLCPDQDDTQDADNDGIPDGCDICAGHDDTLDTDNDMVPDGCDNCEGFDDALDGDGDGIPNGCDVPTVHNLIQGSSYFFIQEAIDAAADFDVIEAEPGHYNELIDFLGKAVWLRSRSGDPNNTIIDGSGLGNGYYGASVVTCASGEDPNTILEGFMITGGIGNFAEFSFQLPAGGGMLISFASPTVRKCFFSYNTASFGAGLYAEFGSPEIIDCTFSNNGAEFGSGIASRSAAPIIRSCYFVNNQGLESGEFRYSMGGGVYNDDSIQSEGFGQTIIVDCVFDNNIASAGGAAIVNALARCKLVDCLITNNRNVGLEDYFLSFGGGGLLSFSAKTTIVNCGFFNNYSVFKGGGITSLAGEQSPVADSIAIKNSIFWHNTATEADQIFYLTDGFLQSDASVSYCNVQGGWSGPGEMNIATDPLLVNATNGDFRLRVGSPCIDAGTNTPLFDPNCLVTNDLAGRRRFVDDPMMVDRGSGVGPMVDMGAYEYQCDGNIDASAGTDLFDFGVLERNWLAGDCGSCGWADLDGDGDVTAVDLAALAGGWLCHAPGACYGNLDSRREINLADFALFSRRWMETECGQCGGADYTADGTVATDDLFYLVHQWLCGN